VAVAVDPADRDDVIRLARGYRFGGSPLDAAIFDLARGLARRYERDPDLAPLVRFALETKDKPNDTGNGERDDPSEPADTSDE